MDYSKIRRNVLDEKGERGGGVGWGGAGAACLIHAAETAGDVGSRDAGADAVGDCSSSFGLLFCSGEDISRGVLAHV